MPLQRSAYGWTDPNVPVLQFDFSGPYPALQRKVVRLKDAGRSLLDSLLHWLNEQL
jgi:hypothetical protein